MKTAKEAKQYFFVDESGDPYFYDRNGTLIVGNEGCSKILILGFIRTQEHELLRAKIRNLRQQIADDPYLRSIPSVRKSVACLHATDDCPEVREKVFKGIVDLPFKSEFVVARKLESVFIKRHRKSPSLFYDDLVTKLFLNQLHQSEENIIYYSVRGNRARQLPLENAIRAAILSFEERWKAKVGAEISVYPQRPLGEPCLEVIDYMNWSMQRAFVRSEMRYFDFVKNKVSLIVDLYDFDKYPKNYYNRTNPFDINKISPL